jgi:Na+-driven multidrug efflux pump
VMLTTLLALRSWGNFGAFAAMLAAGITQMAVCLLLLQRFWRRHRKQDKRALPESRS